MVAKSKGGKCPDLIFSIALLQLLRTNVVTIQPLVILF